MKAGNGESRIGNGSSARRSRSKRVAIPDSPFATSRAQRGFSLLEVIAAIMLLAIAFTALMKVAGASINLTQNAAEHSEAALWARSLLDSAFVGESLQPGTRTGRFDANFRWQLQVTPWDQAGVAAPAAPLHLYQLDLDVRWGPSTHPHSAHFRTLRLAGPAAGGPAADAAQASR
jgi:general secretion pathway protein I